MPTMTFSDALRSLAGAQKRARGVSLYSRYVNRPLGRVFAAAAATAGLSPNAVTVVSALLTGAGLAVLIAAPPSWATGVGVALLLVLGFALDSADGQVARLTGRGSMAGEWLDHVVDAAKMVGVHAAVLIAAERHDLLSGAARAVPLAYLLVAVVLFSGMTQFELLMRTREQPLPASPQASPSTIRAVALLPADYGILALAFLAWGAGPAFFVIYALLGVATALIAGGLLTKWFRTLASSR